MNSKDTAKNLPFALTICNAEGIIEYMNDKSLKTFEEDGGEKLIGQNLFGCHSEQSLKKLKEMFKEEKENIYTIEKKEKKKMIYQFPLYEEDKFSGFGEISIVIPEEMPHFKR